MVGRRNNLFCEHIGENWQEYCKVTAIAFQGIFKERLENENSEMVSLFFDAFSHISQF